MLPSAAHLPFARPDRITLNCCWRCWIWIDLHTSAGGGTDAGGNSGRSCDAMIPSIAFWGVGGWTQSIAAHSIGSSRWRHARRSSEEIKWGTEYSFNILRNLRSLCAPNGKFRSIVAFDSGPIVSNWNWNSLYSANKWEDCTTVEQQRDRKKTTLEAPVKSRSDQK